MTDHHWLPILPYFPYVVGNRNLLHISFVLRLLASFVTERAWLDVSALPRVQYWHPPFLHAVLFDCFA